MALVGSISQQIWDMKYRLRGPSGEVVDKTIWIRARRAIRRGEELTYDYAIIGERTIPCTCKLGCTNKL